MSSAKLSIRIVLIFLKHVLRYQEFTFSIIRSLKYYNKKIRISVATLLKLEKDGMYLLINNIHRPEYYGPIGGVFKHLSNIPADLREIDWESDYTTRQEKRKDMENDLRGYIYGKHFASFLDWFVKREGRESEQCIFREIREEFREGNIGKLIRDKFTKLEIALCKKVIEGPFPVQSRDYHAQFRYFEIYEITDKSEPTTKVLNEMFERAGRGDNKLILASKQEIIQGRLECGDKLVAPHTNYFFDRKWHGNEPIKY